MNNPYPDKIEYVIQRQRPDGEWKDCSYGPLRYLNDAKNSMDGFQRTNPDMYLRIVKRVYQIEETVSLYGKKPALPAVVLSVTCTATTVTYKSLPYFVYAYNNNQYTDIVIRDALGKLIEQSTDVYVTVYDIYKSRQVENKD